jgi:hypothetical protein
LKLLGCQVVQHIEELTTSRIVVDVFFFFVDSVLLKLKIEYLLKLIFREISREGGSLYIASLIF